jgi:transposase-like protein
VHLHRKEKKQVSKQKVGKYPRAFRERAVERMRGCKNVKELAKELGIHRNLLYSWRDQLSPQDRAEWEEREAGIQSRLERENRALKQALAEKTLEVDFFRGALQKVAARRQDNSKAGETASTTKSGS